MAQKIRQSNARRGPRFLVISAAATGLVAALLLMTRIQQFLAVSRPVGQGLLVVEAWIPSATLRESLTSFGSGSYCCLVLVGGPKHPLNDETTTAEQAADELKKLGFDATRLVVINMAFQATNRTAATAQAVKQWLGKSSLRTRSLDVFTVGVHARKSWVLFRDVLGDGYRVGVIAGPEFEYDPDRWMFSRSGLLLVARNLAGYAYSKIWVLFN